MNIHHLSIAVELMDMDVIYEFLGFAGQFSLAFDGDKSTLYLHSFLSNSELVVKSSALYFGFWFEYTTYIYIYIDDGTIYIYIHIYINT